MNAGRAQVSIWLRQLGRYLGQRVQLDVHGRAIFSFDGQRSFALQVLEGEVPAIRLEAELGPAAHPRLLGRALRLNRALHGETGVFAMNEAGFLVLAASRPIAELDEESFINGLVGYLEAVVSAHQALNSPEPAGATAPPHEAASLPLIRC